MYDRPENIWMKKIFITSLKSHLRFSNFLLALPKIFFRKLIFLFKWRLQQRINEEKCGLHKGQKESIYNERKVQIMTQFSTANYSIQSIWNPPAAHCWKMESLEYWYISSSVEICFWSEVRRQDMGLSRLLVHFCSICYVNCSSAHWIFRNMVRDWGKKS